MQRIGTENEHKRAKARLIGLIICLALALSAIPSAAFAEFSNPSIRTVAQMLTNNALHVVEQRTYDFSEDYSAITWYFSAVQESQEIKVSSVRIMQIDSDGTVVRNWTALEDVGFDTQWRDFIWQTSGITDKMIKAKAKLDSEEAASSSIALPAGECYAFDKRRNNVYVFMDPTKLTTVIECDYTVENAALVYDDIAELYWDYIAPRGDVQTSNVKVQLRLPVPEGSVVVPGQTVLAWGHGPDGTVEVRSDGTVDFMVGKVNPGQYAQAHVLFPKGWLSNIPVQSKLKKSGPRFDDAVAEEAAWTDSYSAWRINGFIVNIIVFALCMIALCVAVALFMAFGRRHDADADGADPGKFDAAVIGRLLRWNHHSAADLCATLCAMQEKGAIAIDAEDEGDVRFKITSGAKDLTLTPIEHETLHLMFDEIGEGYQSVSEDEVIRFCKRDPEKAKQMMANWQGILTEEVTEAKLFDRKSSRVSKWLFAAAIMFALIALYYWLSLHEGLLALLVLATAIAIGMLAYFTPRMTQLGVDLEAAAKRDGEDDASDEVPEWWSKISNSFEEALVA